MLVSLRNSPAQAASNPPAQFGLFARVKRAFALRRERQSLLEMDDFLLRDIGLTRDQALAEGERPIWDAPSTWRR